MCEYWQLLESLVYIQQAETWSYDPIKVATSKETTPISDNLTFQVSPSSRFAINDLHNSYLHLDVERIFIYTKLGAGAITNDINVFVGDKHVVNFLKQIIICCNDITIIENLDFVFETNI
jgi:hypothetical protein